MDVSEVKEVYLDLLKKGVVFPFSEISKEAQKVGTVLAAAHWKQDMKVTFEREEEVS